MKKLSWIFLVLFLLGAGVRAINVWHPADRSSWRECDEAGIARNYYREGMNILYPRVDWRGDTPGYAEMEFPLFPWTTAVLYKLFGYHEYLGRVVSLVFSLLTLGVFFLLARYLLPELGAVVAAAIFTFNPIFIYISNSSLV
jgi:4-amino-4-deoxy-L-arabinose transferase-like glycosyltransferase